MYIYFIYITTFNCLFINVMSKILEINNLIDTHENHSVLIVMSQCQEIGKGIQFIMQHECNIPLIVIEPNYLKFKNGEVNVEPTKYTDKFKTVNGRIVYIVYTGFGFTHNNVKYSVNDTFMEVVSLIASCKNKAKKIVLICGYLPYSRSDKIDRNNSSIMASVVLSTLKYAGVDEFITFDLHSAPIQGFTRKPLHNIYTTNYAIESLKKDMHELNNDNAIIVSPDNGGLKRVIECSEKMQIGYTSLHKIRDNNSVSVINSHKLEANCDIAGKMAFLFDDIGDTFGTLESTANILKNLGATKIIVIITHGLFSGDAIEKIKKSNIDKIYVTNTIDQTSIIKQLPDHVKIVDISELISCVILCHMKSLPLQETLNK